VRDDREGRRGDDRRVLDARRSRAGRQDRGRLAGLFARRRERRFALIRASATLGGNLCVDTRCNYYTRITSGGRRSRSA